MATTEWRIPASEMAVRQFEVALVLARRHACSMEYSTLPPNLRDNSWVISN